MPVKRLRMNPAFHFKYIGNPLLFIKDIYQAAIIQYPVQGNRM